jgi:phosphate uptake regulator
MTLPVTMDMTLVARFYERLGDHARNLARRVAYLSGNR